MAESYGLNFNLAMTTNEDGVVDIGVHVTEERAAKLADLKSQAEKIKKQIEEIEKDTKDAKTVRTSRPSYESLLDQDFARLLKLFS